MTARVARLQSSWHRSVRAFALALALAALPAAAPAFATGSIAAGKPQTGLKVVPLTIVTASSGKIHAYKVEVAQTEAQQAHGMMFRTKMAPNTGMIFPMNPPRQAGFWMENTLIPLDLLFIGADGRIRNIVSNAVPKSRAALMSAGPVAAVLELAGGEADRIGARPGDKVSW
ncbi:MAG: DUF192 domain-containing protein [Sphingomonas sp.]|nr:MAG: DUF192 domain-containing protein [Sphingomonas sp.]